MKTRAAVLILFLAGRLAATSLTGTLKGPDGNGITGVMLLSLSRQAALMSGGCGGPVEVVPTLQKRITVTAGALIGSPVVYGNDCLLPAGTYYNVTVMDNLGNTYFTDKWQITGSSLDIGTVVSLTVIGGGGTIGSTGYVQLAPVATQAINQPTGTYFGVNELAVTGTLTLPDGTVCTTAGCIVSTSNAVLLTGNQTVSGIKNFVSGIASLVFNCTATGLTSCMQTQSGTYILTGDGHVNAHAITTGANDGTHGTDGDGAVFSKSDDTVSLRAYDSVGVCGMGTGEPSPGVACSSDQRLKSPGVTVENGLDAVMKLRPVTFSWLKTGKPGVGFIAQEVEKVLPNLVTHDESKARMLMLAEGGMIPYLTSAVQAQQREIAALEAKLQPKKAAEGKKR
jgi:hypothetical protein